MENEKKLYDMLVAEKEFSGTFDEFHKGFQDPAKQAALHKALAEKEYVTAPLDQWQAKYFGGGEKKKPESQVAASSPAPGQQPAMGSEPTGEQQITILPPEPVKEQPAKASQQDMVKELLAKPTEELLFNYASNTMGGLTPAIETPEQQKQVKDLLFRLNLIRSQPGSDMAKLAEAQREIARSSSEAGWVAGSLNQFVDQYATTMGVMERQDPQAYREHMDKRVAQASSQRGKDETAYKQNLLTQSIGDVFDPQGPEAAEALQRVGYEKYKATDPERAKAMLAEADQIRANRIGELEQAITQAEEAVSMMPGSDKGALDQIKAMKQERFEFLNPAVKANKVYAAMEGEMTAVPGKTPQEKMANYYQQLLQEKRDLMAMQGNNPIHGLIESTVGGTTAASARKNEIDGRLKALAPVVFLNQAPVQEDSFLSNIGPAFGKAILGGTAEADLRMNRQEVSGHVLRAMQVAGVSEQDLAPGALEMTKKRLQSNGLGDGAYWGELIGASAGLALPLMVGGAATSGLKAPKVVASKPILNMVFNAAKSGASYEYSAQFSKDQGDELTFLGGFMGGVGKELAGSAIGAMGRTAIGNVFGDKAPEAIKAVTRFGAARAGSGVGETAEEFGQTMAQIAQSSDTFAEFKAGFAKQFPDWSEAAKFAVSTMVMGMAMGGGNEVGTALAQEGQKLVDALPADESVAVKTALQQLAEESIYATEEFAQMAEGFKDAYKKGVEEFAKPEDTGSAATSVEAPVEGYKQSIEPIGVTQEGIAAAANGIPQEQVAPAIEAAQVKGMTQTEKSDAFGEGVRITGMDVTKPLPQAEHMAMIEDIAANPDDYKGAQSSPVVYAIRVGAGLAQSPSQKAQDSPGTTAMKEAVKGTPSEEVTTGLIDIAEGDMGDLQVLATGFAEVFGEGMEVDINAISDMFGQREEPTGKGASQEKPQEGETQKKSTPINLGGSFVDAPGTGNKPLTVTIGDQNQEVVDAQPDREDAGKIAGDAEKKVEEKKGKEKRPKQKEFPVGKILTEYVKMADGIYRLTEYKKDENGNWLFRNASSGDTPLTKNPTFKRDWQPITNTPQARDHIEALAASPARTDLENAINELKAAKAGAARVGAISDPWEVAKQQKRVIDAAINVGAKLIKVGVSDFNDWLDSMAQVTGDAIRKQPKLAELIFRESQKRAAAEQPAPEQKKEAPATQPEPQQKDEAKQAPAGQQPAKKKKKKAKPSGEKTTSTQTKESGVSRLLAKYSRPGVVKTIADSSPVMYQVSDQRAAMAQAADEIEADGIEESFAKVIADPGYSDVLSAKYQLLIDTYGRMGDEAVRENDKEALAEISARIRALEQVVSRKATLGGQFNAMLAMYQSISGAAAPYLSGVITEYNAAILQTKRSGIPIQTLINNITKEINDAKRGMAGAIASDARVDGAIDGSSQNPPSSAKKTIKEKKAEALAEYNAQVKKLGGSLRTGVNPMALAPLVKLGYYTVLDGAVTFASWAAEMAKQAGLTKAQSQEVWESQHEGMSLEAHAEAAVKAGAVSKTVAALSEPKKRQPSEKTKATAAFKDMIREVVTRHIASPDGRMLEQVLEEDAGLSAEDAAKVAAAVGEATRERLGKFVRARLDSVARGAANQAAEPKTATSKAADRAARKLAAEQKGRRAPDTDAAESYDAIRAVVADHAANPGQESLQSKLESQAGLNPAEASKVAASVASATPEALEAFINGRQKSEKKTKEAKPRRTKADIILDTLVNSAVANDDVLAALAKKLGIRPNLTPEQYMELQRLGAALRGTPPGSITQQNAAWELAGAIAPLVPVAWWKKGMDMWRSLAYFSLLQGITTHVKNLQSGLERFVLGNFTTVLNPAKWERAAAVYKDTKGNVSKKAQAAFLASPISEVVFKIGAFNRGMRAGGRSFVSSLTTGQGINIYDEGISPDNLMKSRPFFENQKGVLNQAKWVGRMLTAEDAMLRAYYQELEATSDIRFAMAKEGATFGEAWNTINTGLAWKGPAFDQALSQAGSEASAWEQASGKAMPETLVRSRARQILKMEMMQQHGVDPKGPADVAAYNTFTLRRSGIFGKFAHLLNRFITMTPFTELIFRPLFPFVEIVANLCDGMVDAVPIYGLLRPMGLSPTGLVARFTGGESARLGEPGSTLRAAQWERAFAGFWAFSFLAGMMLLGDDDEERVIDYKGGKASDPDDRYKLYVAGIPTIDLRNYPTLLLSFEAVDKWRIMREDRTNTMSETKRAMFAILGSFGAIKDMSFLEAFSSLEKASRDVMTILDQGGTDAGGNAAAHLGKALVKEWAGFYAAPLPTNWGMVRQVWQVYDPTKPATTDMGELLCYSLGISKLTNTKRVDMFGNITEGYPGNDIAAVNAMALPKSPEERRLYTFLDKHNVTLPAPINRSMILIDEASPTGFTRRPKTPKEWEELLVKSGKLYKEALSEYVSSEAADDAEMVKVTSAKTSELIPSRVSALRSAAMREAEKEMFGDMLFESGVYEATELGY